MDRIPILQMGDLLLVTIQVDMHDQLALTLQDDLTEKIRSTDSTNGGGPSARRVTTASSPTTRPRASLSG